MSVDLALSFAQRKVEKYLKLIPFAKAARVRDPRQRTALEVDSGMGKDISKYANLFRRSEISSALRAEWAMYWQLADVLVAEGSKFDILGWWKSMAITLPLLSAVARRVLAVPATSCDIERAFSSLKWVRKEWQKGMSENAHRLAILLHFNGVVN